MADLETLESLGFDRETAGRALAASKGDVQQAAHLLLSPEVKRPRAPNQPMRADYYAVPPSHNPPPRPDQPHSATFRISDPPLYNARADLVNQYTMSQTMKTPSAPFDHNNNHHDGSNHASNRQPARPELNHSSPTLRGTTPLASSQLARPIAVLRPNDSRAGENAPQDHAMPQAPPSLSNSSEYHSFPPPRGPDYLTETLQRGMFVDVRDTLGKWLEAEVIEIVQGQPKVHYIGWESKWDELVSQTERIASCHRYSSKESCGDYKGKKVYVFALKPAGLRIWTQGMVNKVDGLQVQVEYMHENKKYQYWYHMNTDEIRLVEREKSAEIKTVHPDMTNGAYFQGQFLEVRDPVTLTWRAAEVRRLRPETNEILIHYDGLAASWDEHLHVEKDAARIKPLGADIPDTPEIIKAKREDEEFREGLKNKGMTVVDVERDGNCLFRSVAHQMYNDVSRHAEVRKLCYDHMLQDQEFFSCFIPEDFAKYVARQQKLNEWGDHPEVVALREIFNVNVEVWDKEHFPNPMYVASTEGIACVLRLTFHGHNHYNSLVGKDVTLPLLDLARTTKVNLKQLRQSKIKTLEASVTVSDAKEDPTLERQNTIRTVFGRTLTKLPVSREPHIADLEDEVKAIVKKHDRKGYIIANDCRDKIVPQCLQLMRDRKVAFWKANKRSLEISTVNQEYDLTVSNVKGLGEFLCSTAFSPINEFLVQTPNFERNLLMNLDMFWGKVFH